MDSKNTLFQSREMLPLGGLLLLALTSAAYQNLSAVRGRMELQTGHHAMIAENFYRNGFQILYPQVNWGGNILGYIGSEFPLVPFFAALLYTPFGVYEGIGSSISLDSRYTRVRDTGDCVIFNLSRQQSLHAP